MGKCLGLACFHTLAYPFFSCLSFVYDQVAHLKAGNQRWQVAHLFLESRG